MSWGLWVIGLSTIAAVGLVIIQSWVLRRTSSTAIAADRTQYATDIAVNLSVLAALAVTLRTGWQRADPAFALGISGYMLWNARGIAAEALRQLIDRELEDRDRDRVRLTVLACAGVRALHYTTCARAMVAIGCSSNFISPDVTKSSSAARVKLLLRAAALEALTALRGTARHSPLHQKNSEVRSLGYYSTA